MLNIRKQSLVKLTPKEGNREGDAIVVVQGKKWRVSKVINETIVRLISLKTRRSLTIDIERDPRFHCKITRVGTGKKLGRKSKSKYMDMTKTPFIFWFHYKDSGGKKIVREHGRRWLVVKEAEDEYFCRSMLTDEKYSVSKKGNDSLFDIEVINSPSETRENEYPMMSRMDSQARITRKYRQAATRHTDLNLYDFDEDGNFWGMLSSYEG